MGVRLVIGMVVATNTTIPHPLAMVVRSVSHALVLWVGVMVVTGVWVWGGGHMAGVLGHAKHTCWVWGEGSGGRKVGM